jgi:hypothetical protein
MVSKKILIPVFAIVIGGGSLLGVSSLVHAQSGSAPFNGLSQAIASKFGLSQSNVQSVIDTYMQQQRQTMIQNMHQRLKDKLNQEVQQGQITATQETEILNELSSLKGQFNPSSFKSMTQQQRQQAFQTEKSDLQSWAQSEGINISLIPFGFGMGHGRFGHRPMVTATPTP